MSTTNAMPEPDTVPQTAVNQGSLTSLVSGIVDDAQRLFKQQLEMVRAEVKEDFRRTTTVAQCFAVAAALALIGGSLLIVALVHLLHEVFPSLPMSACWAIIGVVALVAAVIAAVIGARTLAKFNPLPDKSLNALQENVSWIANPQK